MTIAGTVKSAVVAACVLACAWGALAEGGAREPRPACPEPTSAVLTKPVMEKTGEGRQVTARLIELLGDARSHTPNLERGLALLAPHWRQMRPPYAVIDGDNKRLATSIALRTSGDEKQWAVATASGGTWTPDARTWNMSEGSFDQRESIFAPTPSSITFRVTVPTGGALEVALGTANVAGDATTFRVVVHDPIVLEQTGDKHADLEAGVRQINAFIEARVRERPEEWFWVHKRWAKEAYDSLDAPEPEG